MELGNFSISLTVKDLDKSRGFYETLGFAVVGGDAAHGWLIVRNGACTIGLFQGMFDRNTLTFNPGWDANAEPLETFEDVRALQHKLKQAGISLVDETDPNGTGPGSFIALDPDGNPILVDQHVPKPK